MEHILPPEGPRRDRSALGVAVLVGALALSLVLNATLGIVIQDERAEVARLRDRVDRLQAELGATPGGSPASIQDIAAAVERLRELRFKRAVEPTVLDAESLQDLVRDLYTEDNPKQELEALEAVLVTLGVVAPEVDVWDLFVAAQEEQVAGFYDSEEGELFVLGEDVASPSPFTRIILAHELTHAVTDQHFDLTVLDRLREDGEDDAAAAYLALVEGDATLLMTIYLGRELSPDEQLAAASEQAEIPRASFDAMPAFLRESLTFPYTEGLGFVQALHGRGGFAAVDDAYRDPPASTEQILHPERYLDRDDPERVRMPDVRAALGDGWRPLIDGGVGELDLRLIADLPVRSGGLNATDAAAAAAGWDGGAYEAFAKDGATLVAISTAWDSARELREGGRLFSRWLPLRYGNRGSFFDVPGGTGFGGADGAGLVARSGDRLVILLGPDEESVRAARAAF